MNKFLDKLAEKAGLKTVELGFSSCGEILIDRLPFSFAIVSNGKESRMGLCVTLSGEAVHNGEVAVSGLEISTMKNGKMTKKRVDFPLITKSDGKRIYQARFEKLVIQEHEQSVNKRMDQEQFLRVVNSDIRFSFMPHYSGEDMPEVMLSVFPYENPLTGSATQWLKVTSDQDYFLHKLGRVKGFKKRRKL